MEGLKGKRMKKQGRKQGGRQKKRQSLSDQLICMVMITFLPVNLLAIVVSSMILAHVSGQVKEFCQRDLDTVMDRIQEDLMETEDAFSDFLLDYMTELTLLDINSPMANYDMVTDLRDTFRKSSGDGFYYLFDRKENRIYLRCSTGLYSVGLVEEMKKALEEDQLTESDSWGFCPVAGKYFLCRQYDYLNETVSIPQLSWWLGLSAVNSGLLLSYPYVSIPDEEIQEVFGEEAVCLRTHEPVIENQDSKGVFWTIPATSTHREEAMRFLDRMYADARISNLIQYGIRGKHYVVLDVETGSIGLPYGVSRQTTGYYNPLGLYGDRRKMYTYESPETIRRRRAYSEEAMQNRKPFRDFVYSSDNVSLELSAVTEIVERYAPVLESGCVDLDSCYQEFLMQLQLAGIDRIIADKQAQYDRWLAQQ